jgi:predicted  nucleic acid-binding Zn-ribbon protein
MNVVGSGMMSDKVNNVDADPPKEKEVPGGSGGQGRETTVAEALEHAGDAAGHLLAGLGEGISQSNNGERTLHLDAADDVAKQISANLENLAGFIDADEKEAAINLLKPLTKELNALDVELEELRKEGITAYDEDVDVIRKDVDIIRDALGVGETGAAKEVAEPGGLAGKAKTLQAKYADYVIDIHGLTENDPNLRKNLDELNDAIRKKEENMLNVLNNLESSFEVTGAEVEEAIKHLNEQTDQKLESAALDKWGGILDDVDRVELPKLARSISEIAADSYEKKGKYAAAAVLYTDAGGLESKKAFHAFGDAAKNYDKKGELISATVMRIAEGDEEARILPGLLESLIPEEKAGALKQLEGMRSQLQEVRDMNMLLDTRNLDKIMELVDGVLPTLQVTVK